MKRPTPLFYCSLASLCLFQFYSCIKPPPNFEPGDASNVYTACRVKKITNYYPENAPVIRVFAYNSNNDPVSVTNSQVGTGNPNLSFRYDNKKRLIQYGANYRGGGSFELLHRYGYSQNRITTDTVYALGSYNAAGEPVTYVAKRIAYVKYDKLNRVVADSTVTSPSDSYVTGYYYNQQGNLLVSGPTYEVKYDNKLNPHRTNKIWMFIDRDYSVNTSRKAVAYNSAGLPLSYNPATEINSWPYNFGYSGIFGLADLEYDCK